MLGVCIVNERASPYQRHCKLYSEKFFCQILEDFFLYQKPDTILKNPKKVAIGILRLKAIVFFV